MFFHLILTTQCNLQCKYCFGEANMDFGLAPHGPVDHHLPERITYSVEELDKFCRQDLDCSLIFYGGEPLLCTEDVKKIMDNVNAKRFLIQTNGMLLDRLGPEYINRLHTIAVSVDGDEALTDFYRGKGTFKKVVENLHRIKREGFGGELIARMTVMEQTDIRRQVEWLLDNDEFSFSSVHWQLNAGFWDDFRRRDFKRWVEQSYNPGIRRLAGSWVDKIESGGTVPKLYPFLGALRFLMFADGRGVLPCGSGWINYAVQTDGRIIPCPSMWGMRDFYLGHISDADPLKLKKVFVGGKCQSCDVFNFCGGRCLYSNVFKRWGDEEYSLVCSTVRALADSVAEQLPRINRLIEDEVVSLKDFEFTRYNGCEIIP
ncbi:MAG: TIGR04084 family radical SAM/SPASM domain-containing protein [Candidatus Hadarchaeota archaeon]